jgi:hypothetical protein
MLQNSMWIWATAARLALQGKVIILFQDKFSCLIAHNEAKKSLFILVPEMVSKVKLLNA